MNCPYLCKTFIGCIPHFKMQVGIKGLSLFFEHKYLTMLRNKILLMKTALAAIFVALYIFNLKVAFTGENLLWMIVVCLSLLFFLFYRFEHRSHSALPKHFNQGQQLIRKRQDDNQLLNSSPAVKRNELAVLIGNKTLPHSYFASVFNIRVKNSVAESIAGLQKREDNGYIQKADPGKMNRYSLIGGDQVLHIGPEFTGCRTARGGFSKEKFKKLAGDPRVKLIELDLSTPVSPFGNLISTIGISYVSIRPSETWLQALGYTVFSDADTMILFLEQVHNLSGKPVGIKLRIESKKEFYKICYAIKKAKFSPQFIVVASSEQVGFRTDNEPSSITMPLCEAVLFVSKTLEIYELDKKITVIAAANILTGADLLKLLSIGANIVWSEISGYKVVRFNEDGTKSYLNYDRLDVKEFYDGVISGAVHIMEARGIRSLKEISFSSFF
jgi:hypothetical protein